MLATLAKSNPYVSLPEPDMQILYILGGVFVVASVFVVVFRVAGKWNENRKVKASSWRTFSKIAKVKGHITQEQVDAQTHRVWDKQGNDQADHAADVAVQTHGEDVVGVARILHARHFHYCKFMGYYKQV